MEMEDNNSSIFETQLDVHAEKDCTWIKDNTNNIEEHNLTLDKGILHSIDKGNECMPSASSQGTFDEGLGDSFVKDDLSNSEKADGRRKRGKRTKSANTSKKTEIDECAMMLKPPGSSLPMKSAFEIVQKSSPVSCIQTMMPETMQKEVEEFISPDSGVATLCPCSNSLEITPSSGFESCIEYGKTPSATKRGNATEVEETDLNNIIDEQKIVDLVRKLQRNYIQIKSEIDPLSGLADELFQAGLIGEQNYDKIRSARDMTMRSADLLLKAVAYNITPLKLKKFIYFLRKCNYDYIADLLQNNSIQNLNKYSDLPQVNNFMNLQRKFGKLKKLLLKDFDPRCVIDELLEMEVISFIDHEDIWTTQLNDQRIDCVLECVKRNIEINLGPFSSILRNHSEWLAEEIDLLSNDPESSDNSDANAVLELSCKKGNWTGRIEGPFKSIPDFNLRIEFKTEKIQNVDDDVVRRQGDSTNLSLDVTLSKVHCKCDRVDKGSIIVRLQPLSIRALQKLKDSKPEDVMAIVKCLLTNEDLKKLEAAKLTSVEIKIEALDSTLPNPISLKEEGISEEAIVEHFTYLSTSVLTEELGNDEIQMNYSYLLDELDGREFLKIFPEKGFFQKEIYDKILRSRNRRERTKAFIDFVLESKKDVQDLFFQELKYKHQTIYYVLISTKQASKPSAESLSTLVAMKAAICERYDEVIGETEPKAYRDAFVERKIFTDQEFQELVKICPKENRAAAFLKKLLNGNNVFALKTFLWVLKRTGNESLANGLENDFYMFDGEEVNSPDIDGTNKCTLMTAVLEAQIIVVYNRTAVKTTTQQSPTQRGLTSTTSTNIIPTTTTGTSTPATTTVMITSSTTHVVTRNTLTTTDSTSSLTAVMATSSETSTSSVLNMSSSVVTNTIQSTTLHENEGASLSTNSLLSSSEPVSTSTQATATTSIDSSSDSAQTATNTGNLDLSESVSRVSNTSYWDELAKLEPVEGTPDESQREDGTTASPYTSTPLKQSVPLSFLMPDLQTLMKKLAKIDRSTARKFNELDDRDVKLPSLGTRVCRGPDWDRGQQDDDGPGTIISHHANKRQVLVEWDNNGTCDFYRFDEKDKQDVMVVNEPRVLQLNERIATGCRVRRGKDWMWGNQDGTPGAEGVVIQVFDDGFVSVRWPHKEQNMYRFGFQGFFDLEVCNPNEKYTVGLETQPGHFLNVQMHEANRMPSKVPTAVITSEMENNGSKSTVSIMYTSTMQPPTFINTTMANNDTSSSPMEAITTTGCTIIAKTPAHETQTSAITTTSSVNSNTTTGLTVRFDRTKSIIYSPESVLSRGCYGTIVFKGRFDERDVAVKRCLKEIFYFADREMELLRQSDQHPNVIRYYWNEEDDHFLYIAMELCEGTLQDYVENKLVNIKQLKPIELLHQTMKGLAHLHSLDIVHRDIKPHNILISRPGADGEVRALISDFGFARKLPPGTRFFSSYSDFHGTLGWAAPEISIKSRNITHAVDIFSAGCVMYYVLTRGKHPFGDTTIEIQYRINKGKFKLNQLPTTSDGYIAKDIIQDMLSSVPEARPTAKAVLQHLLFWNMDDKLRFIEATSDWIETKMVPGIENPKEIFDLDWTEPLSQILNDEVKTDKRYKTTTVQDLLRFIRNKRHHYNDLPADVQKSLGSVPDQYLDYFTSRFPSLLVHTYRVMKCCSKEDAFKAYYKHA